jgi:hypothetical protein
MRDLKAAIENLYDTFSPYTTLGMQHCDCGCISEADVQKLFSKPLKELTVDDLVFYLGKAMTTWGEVQHYKHFLPRICELYTYQRSSGVIEFYDIENKLDYAQWKEWPVIEIAAVMDFVQEDWKAFAKESVSEIRLTDLEAYLQFYSLEALVRLWPIAQSNTALQNFVQFFYFHGNEILNYKPILKEKVSVNELRDLIYTNGLTERLQDAFFKNEATEKEYAEKVSVVLQMIEQALKADQIYSR